MKKVQIKEEGKDAVGTADGKDLALKKQDSKAGKKDEKAPAKKKKAAQSYSKEKQALHKEFFVNDPNLT